MKKSFFIILMILFCSFNLLSQSKVTKDEYGVYARILRAIHNENSQTYTNASEFVILQNTTVCDSEVSTNSKIKGLEKDFRQKNRTPTSLQRKFPIRYKYFLVSQSELNKFFEQGEFGLVELREKNKSSKGMMTETGAEVWRPFYRKYSNTEIKKSGVLS